MIAIVRTPLLKQFDKKHKSALLEGSRPLQLPSVLVTHNKCTPASFVFDQSFFQKFVTKSCFIM